VDESKLELRSKKCIFLGYVDEVKGYILLCSDSKSPKFIVRKDVVFDKFAMIHLGMEFVVSGWKEQSHSKEVELQVEAS
jgi:hypothetical protein